MPGRAAPSRSRRSFDFVRGATSNDDDQRPILLLAADSGGIIADRHPLSESRHVKCATERYPCRSTQLAQIPHVVRRTVGWRRAGSGFRAKPVPPSCIRGRSGVLRQGSRPLPRPPRQLDRLTGRPCDYRWRIRQPFRAHAELRSKMRGVTFNGLRYALSESRSLPASHPNSRARSRAQA